MAWPTVPVDESGALAALAFQVAKGLQYGLSAPCCACHRTAWHWHAADDQLYPLHEACVPRLFEHWRAVLAGEEPEREPVTLKAAGRGAYGRRRAAVSATQVTPLSPDARYPAGAGSPYFAAGMPENAPWAALAETNLGHLFVPSSVDEAHARKVVTFWRLVTEQGNPVANGGYFAVGAAVVGPDGTLSDAWGEPPTPRRPRWASAFRRSEWGVCSGCGQLGWPGCVTVGGRCQDCVKAGETADPRRWPDDPAYPGDLVVPEHLTKTARRLSLPKGMRRR